MTISYPLAFPSTSRGGVATIRLSMQSAVGKSESPFTFQQQIQQHFGAKWAADIGLAPMKRAEAETWISFLLKLKGMYGTFLMGPGPYGAAPLGTPTGTPVLDGTHAVRAEVISLRGMTPSAADNFRESDYIQLGTGASSRLHRILEVVDADGSGEAANIAIYPHLRAAYSDGASVVSSSPVGLFRLATNLTDWSVDVASAYGINFTATEVI